ncbi:cupin domain-containing protein [Sediminibacillus halophilus]|uniref:Cupin domain-containing protein n=1 Tax=Sediminibacillus halophilus TaxID=482461 RepID=A0A1G9RTI3_9BACI|nr:cupin domain-containing protein [Sediminibacillus halophilus]SDM26588.1 Cupin domain-containing protein [Sediminibacillus halophilus]
MPEEWEQAEPGVKRKIFTPGESLMMMEVHFEKGAEGSAHSHPHEQLTYCMEGSFEFTIEGVKHFLQAGETLVIPGNRIHGALALEQGILLDTFTPLREDLLK